MGLIEREGTAADGVGSTFEVECDDAGCPAWRPVSPRELAFGDPPVLRAPRDGWQQANDGRTYCPAHAPTASA